MVKFAVFFVAALAFQGILAAPNQQQQQQQLLQQLQQQQQQAQQLVSLIQASSNNAVNSIQNIQAQLGNYQGRLYLNSQANGYAYNLQNVAYYLQQAIQNYQGQQYQQQIQQVYRRLSEIAYSVQQAINGQPNQLQALLQNNVQNAASEAQRLAQIVQQSQQYQQNQQQGQQSQQNQQEGQQSQQGQQNQQEGQQSQQGQQNQQQGQQVQQNQQVSQQQQLQQQYYLNYGAIQALYGILAASQRLQAQYQLRNQNQEQIRSQIQSQVAVLSNSIQNINVNDEQNVQNLANQAVQLSQNIGAIINRLQRQLNNYQEVESRNVIQQVANKLIEIRAALEQAAYSQQGADAQVQIQQLQNRLKANVNGAAAQIERLLELAQPSNQTNSQAQDLNNLVNNVLADGLSALQNLQSQLQINAQNNQNN